MLTGSARRCAVLGSPIAHSLSPALHRAAYAELGLDWSYDAVRVEEDGLADFLGGLDAAWRGLSLTMPLKRVVVPMLDQADAWTQASGGANTVVFEGERRLGFNTDIPGAVAAIAERVSAAPTTALVLGGGATATSVLLALGELGCTHARLAVRDPARAGDTLAAVRRHPGAPEVEVAVLGELTVVSEDLVVSTIPAEAQSVALVEACAAATSVFEVVYDPWPTPLAASAIERGQALVSGLDLLAHQAALQVRLMAGDEVSVDLLREAGIAELGRRAVDEAARARS